MLDNWNIENLTEPFFPGKLIFGQICAKRVQNDPRNRVFYISFSWKQSEMKTNYDVDVLPPITTSLVKFWLLFMLWAKILMVNQIARFFKSLQSLWSLVLAY